MRRAGGLEQIPRPLQLLFQFDFGGWEPGLVLLDPGSCSRGLRILGFEDDSANRPAAPTSTVDGRTCTLT
jgi:hypothetical protein